MTIINDEYITNKFRTKKNAINIYKLKKITEDELNYITNRYKDSLSINESLIRIFNHYDTHPVCPVCGNPVQLNKTSWRKYCSRSCASKGQLIELQIKRGIPSYFALPECREKSRETCLKRYGVKFAMQAKNIQEKTKQTCLNKYGKQFVAQVEQFKDKQKKTCLEKYGTEYYLQSEDCKQKTINKLGYDNWFKTPESIKLNKELRNKLGDLYYLRIKNGFIKKYGVDNPQKVISIKEKTARTCLEKYGETTWSKSEIGKKVLSKILSSEIIKNKIISTKRKNNSFKKSIIEIDSYNILKEKYPDVKCQYKDKERYPFLCDFYVPSLDLFIECNYHWTHGGHPYSDSEDDKLIVEKWKLYNSNYYRNALNCWTIRDVNKRNIAKQNKLNYMEFWNINELKDWINRVSQGKIYY